MISVWFKDDGKKLDIVYTNNGMVIMGLFIAGYSEITT